MKKKSRLIVFLLSVFAALFFLSAVVLGEGKIAQQEKAQRIQLAQALDQTLKGKQELEERLAEISKVKSELELRLREAEGAKASLILTINSAKKLLHYVFKGGDMEKKSRLIVFLLSVFAALFFLSAVVLGKIAQREKAQRIQLADLLDQTLKGKQELEERLAEISKVKSELELRLRKTEGKVIDLAAKLDEAESIKISLSAELSERERVVGDLSASLENEKKEKTELVDRLMKSEEEYKALKAKVEQSEAAKAELEKKLQEATAKGVQLDKIVVKSEESMSQSQEGTASLTEGSILIVNREFDFVVINLGKRNGVKLGTVFLVYRDEESLGNVQVEKVYEGMSTAVFLPDARKEEIREGDNVKVSLSPSFATD